MKFGKVCRHCERSEAKDLDCSSLALLAMTAVAPQSNFITIQARGYVFVLTPAARRQC
jgi:hypothetical protein